MLSVMAFLGYYHDVGSRRNLMAAARPKQAPSASCSADTRIGTAMKWSLVNLLWLHLIVLDSFAYITDRGG